MTSEPLATFATLLLTAATRCRLYGIEHRLTRETLAALRDGLDEVLADRPSLRFTVTGDKLYAEGQPLSASGSSYGLLRRLDSKGIGLLELDRSVRDEDLRAFCIELGDPTGGRVRSRPGLKVGRISTRGMDERMPVELLRVRSQPGHRNEPIPDEAARLSELQRRVQDSAEVRVQDFRAIVYSLVSQLVATGHVLRSLVEVKEHHQYSFLHTCNVATLSMGLAGSLGADEKEVATLGTAALLHDIGKTFVPAEILDKPGELDEGEWEIIRRHPMEGARLLLGQPNVDHTAVVVAYEHHMHYDGVGGYPKSSYRPALASQLIAVADTFDALFGRRSYHKKYEVLEALEILQADRGRIYSPVLVDHFTRYLDLGLEEGVG